MPLVGANGAGKSTLINILAGRASRRRAGAIRLDGARFAPDSPRAAQRRRASASSTRS